MRTRSRDKTMENQGGFARCRHKYDVQQQRLLILLFKRADLRLSILHSEIFTAGRSLCSLTGEFPSLFHSYSSCRRVNSTFKLCHVYRVNEV